MTGEHIAERYREHVPGLPVSYATATAGMVYWEAGAVADLDNYRKRSEREVERREAQARESVLQEWLYVVDSVERAVRLEPPPCAEGMRALLEQMDVVLTHQGVERIGAPGDRFDPERHEAIAVEPSDQVPERTIVAVQRSGYAIGDRVIRPAQVVVARAPEHAR